MSKLFKKFLARIGGHLSDRTIHNLNAAVNYLAAGRWIREKGFRAEHLFSRNEQFWDLIGKEVGDRKVLYLEFGVWRGSTTRYVATRLRHPDAMLHGFDSFEGLPERWNLGTEAGCFSTDGEIPRIDDVRVEFHKGWFQETLPEFRLPIHENLVINLDADLYSSTIYVLNQLRDSIVPGAYLFFDEFSDRHHELKAFDEFLTSTAMKFRLLAATSSFEKVLFLREENVVASVSDKFQAEPSVR
jgi:Macrocin-O-methyltransferase (TylF)